MRAESSTTTPAMHHTLSSPSDTAVATEVPSARRPAGSQTLRLRRTSAEARKMLGHLTHIRADPDFLALLKKRRALLAFGRLKAILAAIAIHQAVVIYGAAGCSKTTQVPQFILDPLDLASRGSDCNIVCTQPCHIAALGAAEWVSSKRLDVVGDQVEC